MSIIQSKEQLLREPLHYPTWNSTPYEECAETGERFTHRIKNQTHMMAIWPEKHK